MFSLKTLRAPFAFSCKPVLFFFLSPRCPTLSFISFHILTGVFMCVFSIISAGGQGVWPFYRGTYKSRGHNFDGDLVISFPISTDPPAPTRTVAQPTGPPEEVRWNELELTCLYLQEEEHLKTNKKKKKHIKAETQWSGLYEVATVGWYVYSQLPSLLTFFIWLAGPITHQPHIHSACSVWHLSPCPPPGLWCNHPHIHSSSWQLRARLEAQGCGLIFMQQQLPVYPDGLHHKLCTAGPGLK